MRRCNEEPKDDMLRDALIQRFARTYDSAIRILTRYLDEEASISEVASLLDFSELIRHAWALGLLREEVAVWRDFRLKRDLAGHTYD